MVNKLKLGLATLSVAAIALAYTPSVSAQGNNATLRVVHASPDAPAVDVYVDDKKTLSSLTYKRVTSYMSIPAGRHSIKVYPTSAKGAGTPVMTQDVELNAGWDYTVAATGKLSSIALRVYSDNLNLPGVGKANVRVYHLSPNAPAVNLAVKEGNVLARNISFPNATDYLQVDAKSYNLDVQTATDSKVVLSTTANLASNSVNSVFAFGLVGETPALSVSSVVDRRGAGTPATGAETSFGFMALIAGMVAASGVALKKIAAIQEQN
jgi:hypothetical protein